METLITLAVASLIYPLGVLWIAITGPHHPVERDHRSDRRNPLPP